MIYGEATVLSQTGEPMAESLRERLEHPTKKPSSWALLGPDGQKYYGIPSITATGTEATSRGVLVKGNLNFIENSKDPETQVDFQGPSFLRLDGSTADVTHGAATEPAFTFDINDSLTVLWYGVLRSDGVSGDILMHKRDGSNVGWSLGTNLAGQLRFVVQDSGGLSGDAISDAATYWDDTAKVVGGRRSVTDDTATLWVDGVKIKSATDNTTGTLAASQILRVGRTGAFYAPIGLIAYAIYRRALTDNEMSLASYALKNYPFSYLPASPVLHVDFRNPKSYPGSGTSVFDLSNNGFTGTITGTTVWLPKGK